MKNSLWLHKKTTLVFLVGALLCASTQIFHKNDAIFIPQDVIMLNRNNDANVNILRNSVLDSLFSYSISQNIRPEKQKDGFWYFRQSSEGNRILEILTQYKMPVIPGITYTQSVFVKSDVRELGLQFSFFSERGHNPVKTTTTRLSDKLFRVSATYTAQEKDKWIRGVDLLVLPEADWAWIEIGFPQIELSNQVSNYQISRIYSFNLMYAFSWWIGIFFISFLCMWFGFVVISNYNVLKIKFFTVFLLILLILASIFYNNLFENVNFIAHAAIIFAIFNWLVGGMLFGLFGIAISMFISIFNQSYAGIAGSVLLLSIWLFKKRFFLTLKYAFLCVSILLIIILLFKFNSILNFSPIKSRLQVWSASISIVSTHPWFGIGVGEFSDRFLQFRQLNDMDSNLTHSHNVFLNILAESGLLGLTFYISFLILIIRNIQFKNNSLIFSAIAVVFFINFFDYTFFYAWVHIPFWMIIGVGLRNSNSAVE